MEASLVGRADVLDRTRGLRAAAGQGALSVLVVEGEPGIGKTAVVEAAARTAGDEGWTVLWVQGVQTDTVLAHAGLVTVVSALRTHLSSLTGRQRDVLQAAVGLTDPKASATASGWRRRRWGCSGQRPRRRRSWWWSTTCLAGPESAEALLFAARRLRHDRAAFVLTRREGAGGVRRWRTPTTWSSPASRPRMPPRCSAATSLQGVAVRLATDAAGDPLALLECGRQLTPVQRAERRRCRPRCRCPPGSGNLRARAVGPPGRRLGGGAAGCGEPRPGAGSGGRGPHRPRPGHRPVPGPGGRRAGAHRTGDRLPASAASVRRVARAGGAERRQAHAALAAGLPAGAARTWHRAEAAFGSTGSWRSSWRRPRIRGRTAGFAAASVAYERAARLTRDRRSRGAPRARGRECPPGRRRRTRAPARGGGPGRCGG